ncbi:MAG: DDE-type integrase/transposase/recombinase [Planctomycetota bacterium]
MADGIAAAFMRAAVLARTRMLDHASPIVRMMGQRDAAGHDAALLERELEIFRSQRYRKPSHQRPHYSPAERAQILEVMKLRGRSTKEAAQRFIVHPNTIRNWQRAVEDKLRAEQMLGRPPWNRIDDGVRRLVHEIRNAFPEPEFGTRTIARHIVRAGIKISRTSVRRVLREEPPERSDNAAGRSRVTKAPKHVQHPTQPNQVWHLDMTDLQVVWKRFEIAAIVDGFSRRIVALHVFGHRPTSSDLAKLVEQSAEESGVASQFLVTDHGSQFRDQFRRRVQGLGLTHVRCQVRTWHLNAKVERVFRDVKRWAKRAWLPLATAAIQHRLDGYRDWHNRFRPHTAHGILTPTEVEAGRPLPEPRLVLQRGGVTPRIALHRRHINGDRRLA